MRRFFKGLLWHCTDPEFPGYGKREDCGWDLDANGTRVDNGHEWTNRELMHYDNIGHAFLCTFAIAMGGWEALMRDLLASTEIDRQPSPGANWGAFMYFGTGVIFFSFFLNSLYVGVLHEQFMAIRSIHPNLDGQLRRRGRAMMCRIRISPPNHSLGKM